MFLRHSVLIFKRINKWPCTPTTMLFDFCQIIWLYPSVMEISNLSLTTDCIILKLQTTGKMASSLKKATNSNYQKKKLTKESASSAPNASASSLIWAFFGLSSDKKRRTSGLSKDQTNFLEVSISLNSATVESYTCSR